MNRSAFGDLLGASRGRGAFGHLPAPASVGGGGGGGGGFTPPDVTGLRLWLDADQLTGLSDGATVSSWPDESGNSNDGTGTGSALPTYRTGVVNGLPAVRFTAAGSGHFSFGNFMSGAAAGEVFVVVKANNDPSVGHPDNGLWAIGSDGQTTHYPFSNGIIYDTFGTNARKTTVDPTPSLAVWHIYNVTSKAGGWTSRLNGTQLFTTASNGVGWSAAPKVGQSAANTQFPGDIAELVIYDNELSAGDRSDVLGYLAAKYAITVA